MLRWSSVLEVLTNNDKKVSVLLRFGAVLCANIVAICFRCIQCLAGLLYDV